MDLHPLVYDICRAALAQVLLKEAADRTYHALEEYPLPDKGPDLTADQYRALIEEGVIDTSASQAVIDLAERIGLLGDDDQDMEALGATYSHTRSRPFPSPVSERLLCSWATLDCPTKDARVLVGLVVAAETDAALDLDIARLPVPAPLSSEEAPR
jgi:hypothetical protein